MSRWKKVWSGLLACAMLLTCQVTALAEETKTVALDVVLVVDDTVSMQTNDPNHIATVALQQFAGSIPSVGSRVGMATYSADLLTQQPVIEVDSPEDAEQLRQYAQNGLTQNGRYTDLPSALKYAVDQLNQLDGIHSMEINYLDHGVTVNYDNGCLPYDWLQNRMGAIGYLPKEL